MFQYLTKDKQFSILRATGFIEQILFYFVARKMRKKMIIQNQYDLMLDSRLKKLTSLVISCFLSGLVLFAENIVLVKNTNSYITFSQLQSLAQFLVYCALLFSGHQRKSNSQQYDFCPYTQSQQSAETQTHAYYKNLIIKKDSRDSKLPQSDSQRSAISF
ncbi:hypothetical protein pb186bvf_011740 [Paramecium bursaria]